MNVQYKTGACIVSGSPCHLLFWLHMQCVALYMQAQSYIVPLITVERSSSKDQ